MPSQQFSAAAALFKNVYIGRLRDTLNEETPGVGILQRVGKESWSGASVTLGLRTGRNRSYRVTAASTNETAALPTSGRQTFGNYTISSRLHHGVGGVTAFGSAASQGSDSAFGDMLTTEVDGIIADAQKDLEIDFYGTPLGVLARVNGAIGNPGAGVTANVVLDAPVAPQLVAWDQNGNRFFSPGQLVDFMDEAGAGGTAINAGAVNINSVSAANRTTIVVDGAAAWGGNDAIQDEDLVVRSGTFSAADSIAGAGAGDEPDFSYNGLESLIEDGTTLPAVGNAINYDLDELQNVDRSANTYAQGTVFDGDGLGGLQLDHIHQLTARMRSKANVYPDLFLTDLSVQWAIANLMLGGERYAPQEFPGGFKAMSLVLNMGDRDIPIVVSRECPYNRLYALDLSCIANFVLTDFEMIETSGSVLRQAAAGGDEWEFAYRRFGNIGSPDPQGLGKMVRIPGVDPHFGVAAARYLDF